MTKADANEQAWWSRLQGQAVPLLMLDLPTNGRALEAGQGSAGALLTLTDMVETVFLSDTDVGHLARLKESPLAFDKDAALWATGSPARALERFGPVDLLLLSGGIGDLSPRLLAQGLRPGAQVAVAASRIPGSAVYLRRWLKNAGLRELSIMVPWPSARQAAAWVDVDSATAWGVLQAHFRPSTRTLPRRTLAWAWRETEQRLPMMARVAFRSVAAAAYVVGRR